MDMYRNTNPVLQLQWSNSSSLVQELYSEYRFFLNRTVDPRTKDWMTVLDPASMLAFLVTYIATCCYLGPVIMKCYPPISCKPFYITYSFLNALANGYTFYELLMGGWLFEYNLTCQPIDYSERPTSKRMVSAIWCFYMIKMYELLDSVFYVLWKKDKYRTVLHFHHHTSMLILAWAGVKWFPGGHGSSIGVVNCFHHMIGYLHFGLAKLRWCLWLKKIVRSMTIVEVVIAMIHFPQVYIHNCNNYPTLLMFIVIINQVPILLYAIHMYRYVVLQKQKHS